MRGKVVIVPTGNGAEEEELRKLLEEAGYEVCPPEELADEEAADRTDDPTDEIPAAAEEPVPVCVVLLPAGLELDEETGGKLARNAGRGVRNVGVWPRGTAEGKPPRAFEDFGSSVVPWDLDRLQVAIEGEEPVWETPAATPRPQPVTARHKC